MNKLESPYSKTQMESIDAMLQAVNRKGCVAQLFIKEDGSEGYKIFKNEQESHNQVKGYQQLIKTL